LKPGGQRLSSERFEPELGATRGQGFDDATDVVADQTELRRTTFLLHRSAQRRLSVASPIVVKKI